MLKSVGCIVSLVMSITGCVSGSETVPADPLSAPAISEASGNLPAIAAIAASYEKDLSGTLLVRKGAKSFIRGFGFSDVDMLIGNSGKTTFLIASNAKNFTAAAILRLQDLGKLKVTTPLHDLVPDYPKKDLTWTDGTQVTLHHLLSHTSGLDDAYRYEPVKSKLFKESFGMVEILAALHDKPLKAKPGTRFDYSNTGYILLGEVVRRVSGVSYSEFVKKELFERAQLNETFVGWPGANASNLAWSFDVENGQRVEVLARSQIKDRCDGDVFTDGNIYTTVTDLDRWLTALLHRDILSKESRLAMLTPNLEEYGYGLGILDSNGQRKVAHAGSWIGYRSWIEHYPEHDVTIIFNSNQTVNKRLVKEMMQRIADDLVPAPL